MPTRSINVCRGLLLVAMLVVQTGCAGKNLLNWKGDSTPVADGKNPVRKVICIWEPVQGQGLDGLPTRGFAGQIMFFTNSSPSPATSEGDVRVYLFHDRGTPKEQAQPIHQFDFKGKAWATHLSDSIPGPSYRIFIPYVDKQPWQVNCSIRVRLIPPGGRPVYSEMVHIRLPGPIEDKSDAKKKSDDMPHGRPKLTLTRKTNNIADFQFGATLNHKRFSLAGGTETAVEPAGTATTGIGRHMLDSPAGMMRDGRANTADQPLAQDLRQMLEQSTQVSKREIVRGTTPSEPETARRFRLSPTTNNTAAEGFQWTSPNGREGNATPSTHNEAADLSHPLGGF